MIVKKYNKVKRRFYFSKKNKEKFKDNKIILFRPGDFIYFLTQKEWNRLFNKKLAGLKGKALIMKKRYLCSFAFIKEINKNKTISIPLRLRGKEEK